MKAVIWTKYGPPDGLQPGELEIPVPGDKDVLIKIYASTVTAGDCEMRSLRFPLLLGLPMRIYAGWRKPKRIPVLGQEVAGEIVSTGKDVTRFKKGDRVFGSTGPTMGGYAEYICLPEEPKEGFLEISPENITHEEAATIPVGGLEAMHFLKKANLRAGQKMLINGAGGSIGTYAVQLAKYFQVEVTAVDSTVKMDMLRSIGADHLIDYTREDFTGSGKTYDVILDTVGKIPYSRIMRSLTLKGYYLLANPSFPKMFRSIWTSLSGKRKVLFGLEKRDKETLAFLREHIEAGKLKQMKKRVFIGLCLVCILASGFAQNKEKDYSEAIHIIEVWLEAQRDYEQLPGLSAAAVKDQEILWSGAFGYANPENNVKAKPITLYSICSISKLFTSVAIMILYDQGKLRLDDRVEDLLPWYDLEQQYADSWPVTVRTLLTHSSGLPREANAPYWTGPDFPFPSSEVIQAELENQKTLYPSSTYFQYSNLALTLLGNIVEEVSGIPYEDYVKQNILDPLGLENTRTELPEDQYGKSLAIGYSALTRGHNREKVELFRANGITPAAGFSSNVVDLGKFASWQFRLMDSTVTEVLKPSTLKYMQNVHWTDPDWKTTWGLGFSVYQGEDGKKWVGHGGNCPGYRSSLMMLPESKRAYSVMINANGTDPGKYARGIDEILEKADQSFEKDLEKDQNGRIDLSEYKGYYSPMPWNSEEYISSWYGKLAIINLPTDSPAGAMSFFKHIEGDTFRRERDNGELGETLVFERDKDGRVIQYKRHGNYTRKINRP